MRTDILAAIDIGSNAVRLLIHYVEMEGSSYELKKAAYLRVPIRLGEDVFTQCRVSGDKSERLLNAMRSFTYLMQAYGVSDFRACATSAMRDAVNGTELVAAIKEQCGIALEIISGEEEADLIHTAGGHKNAEIDAVLYVDVGGGSTELVLYKDNALQFHDSFRLGTVRMLVNNTGEESAVRDMEKERFSLSLKDIHARYAPVKVIASGGNINKAHKMLGKKSGEVVKPGELKELRAKLKPLSLAERMHIFGLNDYRADVIVPALEIFLCITKKCPSICSIHVPKIGLADGLIHDLCKKRLAAGTYNQEEEYGR